MARSSSTTRAANSFSSAWAFSKVVLAWAIISDRASAASVPTTAVASLMASREELAEVVLGKPVAQKHGQHAGTEQADKDDPAVED